MKSFKQYITEIKFRKAQRLMKAALKKQRQRDAEYNAFHDIMGTSPAEKLNSAIMGHDFSADAESIFQRADAGIYRQIARGAANPKNEIQHAKNVLGIAYPSGGVKSSTMGTKMSNIRHKMGIIRKGGRGGRVNIFPEI